MTCKKCIHFNECFKDMVMVNSIANTCNRYKEGKNELEK